MYCIAKSRWRLTSGRGTANLALSFGGVHFLVSFIHDLVHRLTLAPSGGPNTEGQYKILQVPGIVPVLHEPGYAPFDDIHVFLGSIGQNHQEFITAISDYSVRTAHRRFEDGGNLEQHKVTRRMAEAGIDLPEAVNIDHQEAEGFVQAVRAAGIFFQHIVQRAPIVDFGQWIAEGLQAQEFTLNRRGYYFAAGAP